MQNEIFKLIVQTENKGERLDKFIVLHLPDLSRNRVQSLLESGNISLSGKTINDRSYRVKPEDEIIVTIPPAIPTEMVAADIPLDIVYEDDEFLVINKPVGLTVHPGAGNHNDTMANALLAYCGDSLSGIGGVQRPGIVHRLDKDTSGLILAAKTDRAHKHLSKQISKRTLARKYLAICWGVPKPYAGTIIANIGRSPKNRKKMAVLPTGGKEAITHYEVKEVLGGGIASLVECKLETGRTHQIRVHMTHIKHPLVGDQSYGSSRPKILRGLTTELQEILTNFNRQALHSYQMGVENPVSGDYMEFTSEFPEDFKKVLSAFRVLKNKREL